MPKQEEFKISNVSIYVLVGETVKRRALELVDKLGVDSMQALITKLVEDAYKKHIGG